MREKVDMFKPVIYVQAAAIVAITVFVGFINFKLFTYVLPISIVTLLFVFFKLRFVRNDIERFLIEIGAMITDMNENNSVDFPVPVIICRANGEIVWFNQKFSSVIENNQEMYGKNINEFFPNLDYKNLTLEKPIEIQYDGKDYSTYILEKSDVEQTLFSIYFIDNTELKTYYREFVRTKPAVMIAMIDNYDEIMQSTKDGEYSQTINRIDYEMTLYSKKYEALMYKTDRDRFVLIMREEMLKKAIENKFEILDTIRNVESGDRMNATLSIGVARDGENIRDVDANAGQALDMSLGRGGDQAAVKTPNGYDFYGGVSKGIEKRTKVKSRIVATALMELIESCEDVIIMGHRFPDLDAFGAAVGLSKVVEFMGKPVHIAIRSQRHLVSPLYEKLYEKGYDKIFAEPETLLNTVNGNTLLIIVDTHVEAIVESPELYRSCKHVVVIDHHRKMVGHIDNAVIFYHEPYASSASEMVAEIIQYFGKYGRITMNEAEALLAGIMLDTKNFVLKTGVRTFEAAAFLKKMGADTVEVKKLFSDSMETYQSRANLVFEAEIYNACAIAATDNPSNNIRVIAAQAADELLTITGVDASFVMFTAGNEVSVSARSMGKINVQLIMEELGGGGHMTMSGAQMKDVTLEEAKGRLYSAIDKYLEENQK